MDSVLKSFNLYYMIINNSVNTSSLRCPEVIQCSTWKKMQVFSHRFLLYMTVHQPYH